MQSYYEGELEENEEPDFISRVNETKVNRKRAEEDVKLLANRISLLKAEEKKVSHIRSHMSPGLEKD